MAIDGVLTHIGVCVSDMERATRFYRDALGFRFVRELRAGGAPADTLLELRGVDLHAVYLERDGFEIELLHYASPTSPATAPARTMNDLGFTHLSFRVPDIEATARALEAAGARILEETWVEIGGERFAVFLRDPDGLPIELVRGTAG